MAISMSASPFTVPHLNTCDVPTTRLLFPPSSRIFGGGRRGVALSSGPRNASFVVSVRNRYFENLDHLLAQSDNHVLVDVVKIDTEKYPSIADKYRIEALPTFILFKDGIPFDRIEGAPTANQFIQRIEYSLKVM